MKRTLLALTLGLLLTCDSPNPTAPTPDDALPSMMGAPAPNVTITLSPPVAYLTEGDTLRFSAIVVSDADTLDVNPWWSMFNTTVASVDTTGLVTAKKDGFAVLLAQYGSGLGAAAIVVDTPADPVRVSIVNARHYQSALAPVVEGDSVLFRVFARADRPNDLKLRAVAVVGNDTLLMDSPSHVTWVGDTTWGGKDDSLDQSFNVFLPPHLVKPHNSLSDWMPPIHVDIDTEDQALEGGGTGTTRLYDVQVFNPDTFRLAIVPVLWDSIPDYRILGWTRRLAADSFRIHRIQDMLPVRAGYEVTVLNPFVTKQDLTTSSGWSGLLSEVDSIRIADGHRAYYYGAIIPPAGSPYGGIAYVGYPVSVGALWAIEHEIGHNMGLGHAPCGGPNGVDPDYPDEGGVTDPWGGFSFWSKGLKEGGEFYDVMSYCHPQWISRYHFNKALALAYRMEREALWWDAKADMEPPEIIADPLLPGWGDSHQQR